MEVQEYFEFDRTHGSFHDLISLSESTDNYQILDKPLKAYLEFCKSTYSSTLKTRRVEELCTNLYHKRAKPSSGRLDLYYSILNQSTSKTRHLSKSGQTVTELNCLIINGVIYKFDLDSILVYLREYFGKNSDEASVLSHGDSTARNIFWIKSHEIAHIDLETAGYNSLPGEIACFLVDQCVHDRWTSRLYGKLTGSMLHSSSEPFPEITFLKSSPGSKEYFFSTGLSAVRTRIVASYICEIVLPFARKMEIGDVTDWLRPYILMRLLAVFDVTQFEPNDLLSILAYICAAKNAKTLSEMLQIDLKDHLVE